MTKEATPEEILAKVITDAYREYWGEEMMGSPFDDIRKFAAVEAMEIFAKQKAIAFDQWKHDNKWVQYLGFDTPTFNRERPEPGKKVYFSSAELYELFEEFIKNNQP